MPDCPFCDIIAGRETARVVHRDASSVAFLDLYPVARGHTLVVPRRHIALLTDVEPADWDEVAAPFFKTVYALARKLKNGLGCSHVTMLLRGLRVSHIHMHLIPSYQGEKHLLDHALRLQDYCQPRLKPELDDPGLDALAEKIRAASVR